MTLTPNLLIGLLGTVCMLTIIAFELTTGVARMGRKLRIHRSKTPGPYWAILALQLFMAAVFAVFGLARMDVDALRAPRAEQEQPAPQLIEWSPPQGE